MLPLLSRMIHRPESAVVEPEARTDSPREVMADSRRSGPGRATPPRRFWSAEEKAAVVIESLRGKDSNISICRRYQISEPTLYKWRQVFLEGGRQRLAGPQGDSTSALLDENRRLKELISSLALGGKRLRPKPPR